MFPTTDTPTNDHHSTQPSSPIVEGNDFWDLNVEEDCNGSEMDFVQNCIDGPSSPADSQCSEALTLSQPTDRRRMVSLQQGIAHLVLF